MKTKKLDKLLNEFVVLEKEEFQNVFGGTMTKPTCATEPTQYNSSSTGVPSSGEICGPDPDYQSDVEDIEFPEGDDRPLANGITQSPSW